ncbi:MAG: circadian clock protein KaiB [Gammaproteobacteria bacterium]|nr:circadian clock protein KaiB [Gammaproteobacteria bacterium]
MEHYTLKLYIVGHTPVAQRAIVNLKRLCEEDDLGNHYTTEVINLLEQPQLAEDEKILATPMLIRHLPLPMQRIIGDLSDREAVLVGLNLYGGDG